MVYYSLNSYNEFMFLVGLISWWYGKGWRQFISGVKSRLERTFDFFSIGTLLSTLFSPFRQISAGRVEGDLGTKTRAFFDKLISRFVGLIVRSIVLISGLIYIVLQGVVSLLLVVFWGLIPLLPVLGLILMALGWTPSWQ